MASKEKIEELRHLINRVPVLRVYIDRTDLKWILESKLTTAEINEKIEADRRPPELYKEVPCSSLTGDMTVTVTSEECADELIKYWLNIGRDGIN